MVFGRKRICRREENQAVHIVEAAAVAVVAAVAGVAVGVEAVIRVHLILRALTGVRVLPVDITAVVIPDLTKAVLPIKTDARCGMHPQHRPPEGIAAQEVFIIA